MCRHAIFPLADKLVRAVFDKEFALTMQLAVFELPFERLIVQFFEEALTRHDAVDDFADVMLSVGEEYLNLAIWLVVFELAAVNISILSCQLALSLPRIKMKLSFVACVFLSVPACVVLDEALAMHFTFQEGSLINLSIWPLLYAIARNLAILEFSGVSSSVSHEECRSLS